MLHSNNKNNLVFDVGMHKGQDTAYYLNSGCRVIAVEADPQLVEENGQKFRPFLDEGRLQIVHRVIWDDDNIDLEFHLSRVSEWNSFDKEVASRQGNFKRTVTIKTARLATLFKQYGIPAYCKLDIENADRKALLSLQELDTLPEFISTETDCWGDNGQNPADASCESLGLLLQLGYKYFKLIDQITYKNLEAGKPLWKYRRADLRYKIVRKISEINPLSFRNSLARKIGYPFSFGASGPWGENTPGPWLDATQAKEVYRYQREKHVALEGSSPYGFWYDWHAKRA